MVAVAETSRWGDGEMVGRRSDGGDSGEMVAVAEARGGGGEMVAGG
jgi:hypothetical protein